MNINRLIKLAEMADHTGETESYDKINKLIQDSIDNIEDGKASKDEKDTGYDPEETTTGEEIAGAAVGEVVGDLIAPGVGGTVGRWVGPKAVPAWKKYSPVGIGYTKVREWLDPSKENAEAAMTINKLTKLAEIAESIGEYKAAEKIMGLIEKLAASAGDDLDKGSRKKSKRVECPRCGGSGTIDG